MSAEIHTQVGTEQSRTQLSCVCLAFEQTRYGRLCSLGTFACLHREYVAGTRVLQCKRIALPNVWTGDAHRRCVRAALATAQGSEVDSILKVEPQAFL